MEKKKRRLAFAFAAAVILSLFIWTLWANSAPERNEYILSSSRIPEAFDGYRIAHVSDLHNTEFGEDNKILLELLRDADPDIIAITGDLIDSRHPDVEIALDFVRESMKIAPCYYVSGNHEARSAYYFRLKQGLKELGVTVLEGERVELIRGDAAITVVGVNDPMFQSNFWNGDAAGVIRADLLGLVEKSEFTVLLSHRPELFDVYVESCVDLVLTGHAHGGQFRFPFLGGLVAPNQGLFPVYDAGLFTEGNTNMIVSRGLGNSIIPLRFNNRPEVIVIELKREE